MLFGLRNNYFSKEKRNEFAHVPRQLFITQQMPPKIGYLFYSSEDLEVRASSLVPGSHCFLKQGTLLHFVSLHPGV